MNPQPNIYDMLDEMSSVLSTLQIDMMKVMNGINQLNLLITKIKQFKANDMNNNMMMNNMMNMNNNINNMQNMVMGMNNNLMGMQNMNIPMPMNGMMMNNMNFPMQNVNLDDPDGWDLLFENDITKKKVVIRISKQKLVKEAISLYLLKSNQIDKDIKEMRFIFNNKILFPEMKICQTELSNGSKIIVRELGDLRGG